jgi:hypothetical protein
MSSIERPQQQVDIEGDADYWDLRDRFQSASPAQIKTYVQSNVTDLASAKTLLIKILLCIQRIP